MKTFFAVMRRNVGFDEMLMGMTCKAESREEAAAKITGEWIVEFDQAAYVDFICEIPETKAVQCVFSLYLGGGEIHAYPQGNGFSASQQIFNEFGSCFKMSRSDQFKQL